MSLKRTMPATTLFQEDKIKFTIHKLGFTASVESYQISVAFDDRMDQLVAKIKENLGGGKFAVFELYLCNNTTLLQEPHLFLGKPLLEDEGFAMKVEYSADQTVQETFDPLSFFNRSGNNHIAVEFYYDMPGYQEMYAAKLTPVQRVRRFNK
ncbi:hypothetical protein FB192DRAFT_1341831 [Mucor lusitanicus]|uniref:Uncharacterized protein n=2 Tax=Mucor circinelloides f. lusitanicus TaxID=29924 RepID=A0A168GPF1_MUCCL|nr:hypothetical protein FB192DRAFT_1341831 [Mucor lusitanicus]OAC97898.1 hypothetical protein MUCCIDRAFT_86754 [Mucor lusitanicus CBS 277.49]